MFSRGSKIPGDEVRMVLVGKPGAGKSATGNTLLKQEVFEDGSGTRSCRLGIREWEGRRLVLIDVPDFDLGSSPAKDSPEGQQCLLLSRPGPHALLLVTHQLNDVDRQAVEWLRETFGHEASKYTIGVFTGGEEGSRALEEELSHPENQGLGDMVRHWCSIDSHQQGGRERESQAEELLSLVKEMLQQNQGKPFCSPKMPERPALAPEDISEHPPEGERPQEAMAIPGTEESGGGATESPPVQMPLADTADPVAPEQEEPELRIVIVGKSGVGKSATGNTILGVKSFASRFEITPVTKSCQLGIREWKGKRVVVIDTPAVFDSEGAPNSAEIDRCQQLARPHPHALVLVAPVGRFTEEDHQVVRWVKNKLDSSDQKLLVVVFSHKERLQNQSLRDYISSAENKNFLELKDQCGGRFCGFNNNETGDRLAAQAEELLSVIKEMAEKKNGKSSKEQSRWWCRML